MAAGLAEGDCMLRIGVAREQRGQKGLAGHFQWLELRAHFAGGRGARSEEVQRELLGCC
jgi:hypothetical protein